MPAVTSSSSSPLVKETPWEAAVKIFNTSLTRDPKKRIEIAAFANGSSSGQTLQSCISDAENARTKYADTIGPVQRNLEKVFERIQVYSSIVDVAIQHDPHITALVWGAVRLILQVITTGKRHRELLSEGVQIVVDNVARVEEYHLTIFPNEVRLHHAISRLYAEILNLLVRVQFYFRRPYYSQIATSGTTYFQNKIEGIINAIQRHRINCEDEVRAATSRSLQIEHGKQSAFREQTLAQLAEQETARRIAENRLAEENNIARSSTLRGVRGWLGASNFDRLRREKQRAVGTCTWIEQSPAYIDWWKTLSHPTLWISGIPGSGKTVIATYLLETMSNDIPVLYFFCNGNEEDKRTAENVIYTLLGQALDHPALLQLQDVVMNAILPLYQIGAEKRSVSLDMLCICIKTVLNLLPDVIVLLDGIDELLQDGSNRRLLLTTLLELKIAGGRPARTLMFSRIEDELDQVFVNTSKIPITPSDIQNDVQVFLGAELDKIPRLNRPGLRQQIMEKLSNGADGMFLWVSLMLETLKRASTPNEVNEFLANLPVGLYAVYAQILTHFGKTLHPGERRLRNAILTWTATSLRPLTISEMNEALAVVPGIPELEEGRVMFEPREDILRTCAPLLHISGDRLQLVHFSVREFLCRSPAPENSGEDMTGGVTPQTRTDDASFLVSVDLSLSNAMIASTCLAYLAFQSLSSERALLEAATAIAGNDAGFARHFQSHAFLEYATLNWPKHLVLSARLEQSLSLQLESVFEPARCLFWLKSYLAHASVDNGSEGYADLIPVTNATSKWLSNQAKEEEPVLTMDDRILVAAMEYGCKLYGDAFGREDDRFLNMANELSSLYQWQNLPANAETIRTELLEAHASKSGRNTVEYAEALRSLAMSQSSLGKDKECVSNLEKALELQITLLGDDDVATLKTYKDLGWQMQKLRIDSARAVTLLKKALYGMQKTCGPRHRHTLTVEMHLADAYRTLGRLEEAETLLKNNYDVSKEVWGPDHVELMTVVYNLARVYREQKKLALAAEHMQIVLATDLRTRPTHVFVSYSKYELGLVYRDMGKNEEAREYLADALRGMRLKLDPESLFIRKTVQELAEVEEELRQHGSGVMRDLSSAPTLRKGEDAEANTGFVQAFPEAPTFDPASTVPMPAEGIPVASH